MSCLSVSATSSNGCLSVEATCTNMDVRCSTSSLNTKLTLSAYLVCGVSFNQYEYFNVQEGPFIVQEGYFKVKKQ